jgi:eukaryotic-like serine/threonine-protein kinase
VEGRVLAGRYRLTSKLGQGGMGSVWRAEHLALGSPLAIKLIDPGIAQTAEAAARFKREAQAAADLRSAHVVQIMDYGVDEGVPFIAMELLDGESLGARLEKLGRLPPMMVATILSQAARALARAHQAGIVHRDLKPDNIFLVREADDDFVKVLDFGIAKKLGALSSTSGIKTGTGAMLGTPYYMSPEQALGQNTIDHRTDIWSLGIIAYECLTGKRPFEKDTLGALLMAICNEPLPTPSKIASVPSGFDAWFSRACARSISARFDSAIEATAELRNVCGAVAVHPSIADVQRGSTVPSVSDAFTPQPEHGSAVMEITVAPSSVTIPGLKRRWSPRAATWALAALVGVIAVIWLARAVMTQSAKPENVSATSATVLSASAENAPVSAPQSPIALGPSTPAATVVGSNSPISQINDLPTVADLQPQARRGPAPKNAPARSTDHGAPASSETLKPPPPPPAAAAPAASKRHDYTNNIGF